MKTIAERFKEAEKNLNIARAQARKSYLTSKVPDNEIADLNVRVEAEEFAMRQCQYEQS